MSWFLSSTNEAEAAKEHVFMFQTVSIDLLSGIQYFWTGWGDLVIGANTYFGAGELGKIGTAPDKAGLSAESKVYELTGIEPTWIAESDIDASHGRSIVESFGFLNPETRALIDTPEINWEGRIDSIRRLDGSTPGIQVTAESRLVILDQPGKYRYTNEHQAQFFSGDLGFDQLPNLELKEVLWGGTRATPGVSGGGGGKNRLAQR